MSVAELEYVPRAIVVDDDPGFLDAMQLLDSAVTISFMTTDDPDESLGWLDETAADAFIADLKMPGKDGVSVLEEAHRRRPDTVLALLTSHDLTLEQSERLKRIGATHYAKMEGLPQLLADISTQPRPDYGSHQLKGYRERINELETLNRELIADFIAELREMPDVDSQVVHAPSGSFTIAELIKDLEALTPRGIEHLRLWLRGFSTIRRLRRTR